MKILISIKSILNYLYNNLIDLVWTKKIRFADGTEMETVPTSFDLFDIKIMSERIATKGWSCISYPTQNKLNKADVPTVYNFLKDKLDNADGVLANWTFSPTTSEYYNIKFFHLDNVCLAQYPISPSEQGLCKFNKEDVNDITKWVNLGFRLDQITSVNMCKNVIFCYGRYEENDNKIVILNKDTYNKIGEIIPTIANERCYFVGAVDNYIYYRNSADLYRIKDTTNIAEMIPEFVSHTYEWYDRTYVHDIIAKKDGYYYINMQNDDSGKSWFGRTNNLFDTTTYPSRYDKYDYCYGVYDNKFICYTGNYYGRLYFSQDGDYSNIATTPYLDVSTINALNFSAITYQRVQWVVQTSDNNWIICYDDLGSNRLYVKTSDFISFEFLIEDTNGSNYNNFDSIEDLTVFSTDSYGYADNDMTKILTVYTDTYTIDGNSITIKYYKNGNFKLCTPDIDINNDTNLQSVYEFLGYLNYFWIDTTNEQITLQRNSNLWTFMYVGNDYSKEFDKILSLPTGNATRLLPQSELIEIDSASITLDILKNKVYKFTNSSITDITFSSNEDSTLPTTIKFTTGNSAPTFTDNSNINWVDGTPVFQANKSYQIIIFDNDGYLKEF